MNASMAWYEKINDNERKTPTTSMSSTKTKAKKKSNTQRRKIIKNLNAQQSGYVMCIRTHKSRRKHQLQQRRKKKKTCYTLKVNVTTVLTEQTSKRTNEWKDEMREWLESVSGVCAWTWCRLFLITLFAFVYQFVV